MVTVQGHIMFICIYGLTKHMRRCNIRLRAQVIPPQHLLAQQLLMMMEIPTRIAEQETILVLQEEAGRLRGLKHRIDWVRLQLRL